ncbi:cysteine--tRNA ligase, partial [Candidatus Thioglobus sp.]|nr:cysteine--tRNA ligase [Candidatus Thioglobus sp.]
IDDKIISRAIENKEDIYSLTNRFINAMHEDEKSLGVLSPDMEPRATDSIDKMIDMIDILSKQGLAYQGKNGDVFYSVRKFKEYGKLSGKNLDDLMAGARVDIESNKKDPLDFVLWKKAKSDEPSWPSPWGDGRPGWHIECSAMSNHFISNHFDIHGGGMDLTFPHHENEIAQSEGANNCKFVNTWMHVGFVNIDDEKMSKSLNNFFTIRDVLKSYDGETLRYFLISSHYRSPLNYSEANIKSAQSGLKRLYNAVKGLSINTEDSSISGTDYEEKFNAALNDDFNTPMALSILFEIAKQINIERITNPEKASVLSSQLVKLGNYIGILEYNAQEYLKLGSELSESEISKKIEQREAARNNKEFALSDQIRDELIELGIILEDSINGTSWRRK